MQQSLPAQLPDREKDCVVNCRTAVYKTKFIQKHTMVASERTVVTAITQRKVKDLDNKETLPRDFGEKRPRV